MKGRPDVDTPRRKSSKSSSHAAICSPTTLRWISRKMGTWRAYRCCCETTPPTLTSCQTLLCGWGLRCGLGHPARPTTISDFLLRSTGHPNKAASSPSSASSPTSTSQDPVRSPHSAAHQNPARTRRTRRSGQTKKRQNSAVRSVLPANDHRRPSRESTSQAPICTRYVSQQRKDRKLTATHNSTRTPSNGVYHYIP